jgi:diamine N-acetyltransferase
MYADQQLVGFAVYAIDPGDESYWIMAYMIDHRFQHRGLGQSGMEELIHYIKESTHVTKSCLGIGLRTNEHPTYTLHWVSKK